MVEYSSHSNAFVDEGRVYNSSIDMVTGIITIHLDPINDLDVANKRYVDNNSGGGGGGTSINVILTGTGYTDIILQTEGSFVVSVKNTMSNGPSASFMISKSSPTRGCSVTRVTSCSGDSTYEKLDIKWDSNDYIKLHKTGSSYDGTYKVVYFSNIN
jgi:hypothetical protein